MISEKALKEVFLSSLVYILAAFLAYTMSPLASAIIVLCGVMSAAGVIRAAHH